MYLFIGLLLIVLIILYIMHLNLEKIEHFEMEEEEEKNQIPKIIIQTWKDNDIPKKYQPLIQSIQEKNPTYQYLFFTDEEIDAFLKKNYPEYYKTYLALPVIIQKIDFFRYVAVYHYGGFYFDLDMSGLKPLDESVLNHESVFPIDTLIQDNQCKQRRYISYCDVGMDILLGQYAFAAKKNDPFIKELIENIHKNIEQIKERYKTDKTRSLVYQTTGPDYVTDVYLRYKKKDNVFILPSTKNQYFGDYAVHNYFGTWK